MDTKVVIFVLISTFLVAAIYSSTVPMAFAKMHCIAGAGKGDRICTFREGGKITDVIYCVKGQNPCIHVYGSRTGETISPDLQNAIDAASSETLNTTKVPNTDILKDNVTLQENNNNNTSDDNVKEPKAPKLPEDSDTLIHEGR